jgi:peptide/nickel transport system substrate-binding protein
MHPTRRSLIAAGALLPFLRQPARAARAPGRLVFGVSIYPPNLLPWANTGASSAGVKLLMFRGLLSYDDAGALRGELAESWSRDGDNAWIFKLRDAVFHNGAKVTSADVKWTIEQVAGERSTAYLRDDMRSVERVETPDARTARIVTKQPVATLPLLMASTYLPIIAQGSSDNGGQPVGAGPYVLDAQERGVSLDFKAFDKFYRAGEPKLSTMRFVVYADENARVAALHAGDVDLIEYVPWQSMQEIEATPSLKLQGTDGPFMYLTFNGRTGPFTDVRLRQAVAFAVKRDEIVSAAFYGRGSKLEGLPIPRSSPFFDEAKSRYWQYDPAKSKALLAQAGMPDGFSCTLLSTAQYGMMKDTATVVQQNLAEVGIKVTLNLPDMATRIALGGRGQFEFSVGGTATDNNDPDGLGSLIDGSLPSSFQRSTGLVIPEITRLLAAGRAELDPAKRRVIYDQLQTTTLEQASFVGLAWRSQGYAMARDLQGFKNLPGALTFYSNLTLDEAYWG